MQDQSKADVQSRRDFPDTQSETTRHERRDAAEHRQRILEAARALFATQGVDTTSMYEIARSAGVGQGTLYRRYAHKGELCVALLHESLHCFRTDVEAYLAGNTTSPLALLEFVLDRLIDFNEENAPLLGAIVDAACGDRRSAAFHSPLYIWLREVVVGLLTEAVQQGEAPALDVPCAVDAVLAPLSIDLYLYQRGELSYEPERIAAATRDVIFGGLRIRTDPVRGDIDEA